MIYYDEYGSSAMPSVILMHGAAVTDTFAAQYNFLAQYHLIVPHIYGMGKEVHSSYEPYKLIQSIAELIGHIGKDKVSIIGHSLGAELAVALVTLHPHLFNKAIFLSPGFCTKDRRNNLYARIASHYSAVFKSKTIQKALVKSWKFNETQAKLFYEYAPQMTKDNYAAFFRKRINLDSLKEFKNVSVPMLVVCGEKETSDMKNTRKQLIKRNKKCKALVLPKAAHDYPLKKPELINPVLSEFLES